MASPDLSQCLLGTPNYRTAAPALLIEYSAFNLVLVAHGEVRTWQHENARETLIDCTPD